MILMIDNYDSFTFNIVQYLGQMGEDVQVYRNDKTTIDGIRKLQPQAIFYRPAPVHRVRPALPWMLSARFTKPCRSWASVWDTSPSASRLAGKSSEHKGSCTEKSHRLNTTAKPFLRGCPIPLPPGAITRWSCVLKPYRRAWRQAPKPPRGKSWDCAIKTIRWRAFSFIRNRC